MAIEFWSDDVGHEISVGGIRTWQVSAMQCNRWNLGVVLCGQFGPRHGGWWPGSDLERGTLREPAQPGSGSNGQSREAAEHFLERAVIQIRQFAGREVAIRMNRGKAMTPVCCFLHGVHMIWSGGLVARKDASSAAPTTAMEKGMGTPWRSGSMRKCGNRSVVGQ